MTASLIDIIDVIGTAAFAVSGATVGAQKQMDLFGVNILGLTTAVGGGVLRDVLLGDTPPAMFRDPIYALIALVMANLVFLFSYLHLIHFSAAAAAVYQRCLSLFDAFGLAAFTVGGVVICRNSQVQCGLCLQVCLGVITGVGGGVLRDVLAMETPVVFVRHVYATASLAGALVTGLLWEHLPGDLPVIIGFILIVLLRVLAARFRWDLPRLRGNQENSGRS